MTVTVKCGDALKLAASFEPKGPTVVITDPVWPNRSPKLWPKVDAHALLQGTLEQLVGKVSHVIIQVGCTTDPRFLTAVPQHWPFWRTCWLRYHQPTRQGQTLMSGDVAYVFGPTRYPEGGKVVPGEAPVCEPSEISDKGHRGMGLGVHPCPRAIGHVRWLVRWFTKPGETVLDMFAGSGTTPLAARDHGRNAEAWDSDPKYVALMKRNLRQEQLFEWTPPSPKGQSSQTLIDTGEVSMKKRRRA